MIFLSIYLTIASITFFATLGYYIRSSPSDEFVTNVIASLLAGFLWPALMFGLLFDLAERK